MLSRSPLALGGLLVASVGVPYVTTTGSNILRPGGEGTAEVVQLPHDPWADLELAPGAQADPSRDTAQLPRTALVPIEEALAFQVTPGWLLQRWPRVTTGLADADRLGYRVSWISGTASDDLAGALTYYFTPAQQLQRITFHGSTGNPNKLIALVTQRFGLSPHPGDDPTVQILQRRWNGSAESYVEIRTAGIMRGDHTLENYKIVMELKNRDIH